MTSKQASQPARAQISGNSSSTLVSNSTDTLDQAITSLSLKADDERKLPVPANEKQSIKQSKESGSKREPFEASIVRHIIQICSYLRLDEKRWRLSVLCRSIKKAFKPATCCNGYVWFMDSDGLDERSSAMESDAAFASQIRCQIYNTKRNPKCRKRVLDAISQSLLSGGLKNLDITETSYVHNQPLITTDLLQVLHQPTVRLTDLYITIDHLFYGLDEVFFGTLKQCKSLTTLTVECQIEEVNVDEVLVECLPESIENLLVLSTVRPSDKYAIWYHAFNETDFLPNLKRVDLREKKEIPPIVRMARYIDALTTTFMTQTDKLRPIAFWMTDELSDVSKVARLPITELICTTIQNSASAELLQRGASFWPNLRSIAVHHPGDASADFSQLFQLGAIRRVRQVIFASHTKNPSSSLSEAMTKALGSCQKLTFLHLSNTMACVFRPTKLDHLLPANCWPELNLMWIFTKNLSEQQLRAMLMAAPNCRYVLIRIDSMVGISCSLVLAMIMFYCPHVARIVIRSLGAQRQGETLQASRDAFERYPVSESSSEKLVGLSIPEFTGPPPVFHFVLAQLVNAPLLSFGNLGPARSSALELCITRCLPHLISLDQLMQAKSFPGLHRGSQFTPFIGLRWSSGDYLNDLFEMAFYIDGRGQYAIPASTFDEIIHESVGADCQYPVLKRVGNRTLFDALFASLSAKDQTRLKAWDRGDYSVV